MKYYKGTLSIAPLIEEVKAYIPYDKIKGVKLIRVPLSKQVRVNGLCTKDKRGKFTISLNLWRPNNTNTHHEPIEMYSVLEILAHELAHARYWGDDHGYKFFKCYLLLLGKFAKFAHQHGLQNFETPIHII